MYENLKQYLKDHEQQFDTANRIFFGDINAINFLKLSKKLKEDSIDDSLYFLSNSGAERLYDYLTKNNYDVLQYKNRNIIHNRVLLKDESHGQPTVQLAILDNREVYYSQVLEDVDGRALTISDDEDLWGIRFYLEPQSSLDAFQLYYQDVKTDNGVIKLVEDFMDNHREELDNELKAFLESYVRVARTVVDHYSLRILGDIREIEKEQIKLKEMIKNKY